ncbi:hypothetical protein GQ37_010485 [Janthinobacterium sp. BJB1]|nr:hypothetical protein GQ37_010485 [Janthinobacterium sp. BJB1]
MQRGRIFSHAIEFFVYGSDYFQQLFNFIEYGSLKPSYFSGIFNLISTLPQRSQFSGNSITFCKIRTYLRRYFFI